MGVHDGVSDVKGGGVNVTLGVHNGIRDVKAGGTNVTPGVFDGVSSTERTGQPLIRSASSNQNVTDSARETLSVATMFGQN